jgi:exosome complex RNA-binding protein Rrp4
LKDYSVRLVRYFLQEDCYILQKLGEHFEFDISIGYNGRVWLNAKKQSDLIFIMAALDKVSGAVVESSTLQFQDVVQGATDEILESLLKSAKQLK